MIEPFNYDKPEEPQYAAYRSDPKWRRIYSFLRHGYWHVTTPEAWEAIQESSVIRPNIGGRDTMRFGDITERSYAYKHGCIALFDFVTPGEEKAIRTWDRAWEILTPLTYLGEEATVLLRLDRRRLRSRIIPNSTGYPRAPDGKIYGLVPHCEVWYPDEIPIDAITGVFRVPPSSHFGAFCPEPFGEM